MTLANSTIPTLISLMVNIGHIGIEIVIEINKINNNKIIKIFKYMNIRTSHNLTTIRSSS